jgi:tetratricopeptide (TPR) repeat protein
MTPSRRLSRRRAPFRALLFLASGAACLLCALVALVFFATWQALGASRAGAGPKFRKVGGYFVSAAPLMTSVRFPAVKPRREFRVFVLGASQAMGVPYVDPDYNMGYLFGLLRRPGEGGIATWLRVYLSVLLPDKDVTVINGAEPGTDLANSLRAFEEIASVGRPDMVVVLSGDNERRDINSGPPVPFYELGPGVDFKSRVAGISADYRRTVRAIADAAEKSRVRTYVLTVPDNLRDYAPRDVLDFDLALVGRAMARGDYGAAEKVLRRGDYRDNALRLFYIAKCLDAEGRTEEARSYYVAAKDQDKNFLRCRSVWNDIIRREARGRFAGSIDAERLLAAKAEGGIPGYDLFHDYCHLKLGANQFVGLSIAKRWARDAGLPASAADSLDAVRLPALAGGRLRVMYFFKWLQWLRASWFSRLMGTPLMNSESVALGYKRALFDYGMLNKQIRVIRDPEGSRHALYAALERAETAADKSVALPALAQAEALGPGFNDLRRVADAYERFQEPESSLRVRAALTEKFPEDFDAWLERAGTAAAAGKGALAAASLARAEGLADGVDRWLAVARIGERLDDAASCLRRYDALAERYPGEAAVRIAQARAAARAGQKAAARRDSIDAERLAPGRESLSELARVYESLGDPANALRLEVLSARRFPRDPDAWLDLAQEAASSRREELALRALARARELKPPRPQSIRIAQIYGSLGRYDLGMDVCAALLRRDPGDEDARNESSWLARARAKAAAP